MYTHSENLHNLIHHLNAFGSLYQQGNPNNLYIMNIMYFHNAAFFCTLPAIWAHQLFGILVFG